MSEDLCKSCNVLYPNNQCGVWLETKNGCESVNIVASKGQFYMAYNAPNHTKLEASKIALVFDKKGSLNLQYFTGEKSSDIKFIDVDKTLVYNLLLNVLKELEAKALALQPVKPIIK